jgi:hypothetical protein
MEKRTATGHVEPGGGAHQTPGERWTHRTILDRRDKLVERASSSIDAEGLYAFEAEVQVRGVDADDARRKAVELAEAVSDSGLVCIADDEPLKVAEPAAYEVDLCERGFVVLATEHASEREPGEIVAGAYSQRARAERVRRHLSAGWSPAEANLYEWPNGRTAAPRSLNGEVV